MARTKQTARKSVGGRPVNRGLATKGRRPQGINVGAKTVPGSNHVKKARRWKAGSKLIKTIITTPFLILI
jgi:hypothetical protein